MLPAQVSLVSFCDVEVCEIDLSVGASGLTAGALKKVGTELVAESGEGLIDAFRATAGYAKEDAKILAMVAELWGWDHIASMFNKI